MTSRILQGAVLSLLSMAMLFASGRSNAQQAPVKFEPPALKISSGDMLEVAIYDSADLSGSFRVDEKGEVRLPLLGNVHAAGETAGDLAQKIERMYVDRQILIADRAHANVVISEYATQGIVLSGEVKNPGIYPALGVRMLSDVLAAGGGFTQTAGVEVNIYHRGDMEHAVKVPYDLEANSAKIPQVQLYPGDTVFVPRAGMVYAAGDVAHAGAFILDGHRGLTLEALMALCGGEARAAKLNRVQLVRKQPDGSKTMSVIDLRQIYKGKSADIALQDGDIVYVPTSTAKLATEQAINSALGIGTAVTIYKVGLNN